MTRMQRNAAGVADCGGVEGRGGQCFKLAAAAAVAVTVCVVIPAMAPDSWSYASV